MASLYLCVDCGGTKTAAAICNRNGTIVGRGTGGPSNITYLTVEAFMTSVRTSVLAAMKEARPGFEAFSSKESLIGAAWFGISGADSPAAIEKVAPAISAFLEVPVGPRLIIANDTHLLAAPIRMYSASHAIAVIAGTGSIAVSFKEEEGRIEELGRVGGWGWILGDEGGGFDVGREALRQLLMEEDLASILGRPSPPSKLRDRILEKFSVGSVMEMLGEVYRPDPESLSPRVEPGLKGLPREKRVSSLPPLVFEAAFEETDWLAKAVLQTSARQLAGQIALLLGAEAPHSVKADGTVISFGGSLVGNEKYRQIILDQLRQLGYIFPHVHFINDAAVAGAQSLAASYASSEM